MWQARPWRRPQKQGFSSWTFYGQLENPSSFDARSEKTGRSDRSKRRSARLCKLLSAEERNRLKGTAVENCDKDLFAIASIGDIQKRTAARFRTPKNPRPPCMKRSVAQDLRRSRNAIPRRRPVRSSIGGQTSCTGPFSMQATARWSGFCVRSEPSSPTSSIS